MNGDIPRRPTVTFDLQNLMRSSTGAGKYSLSVSSKLFKAFTRYCGNEMCPDQRMNVADGQRKNMMSSLTWPDG